MKKFLFLLLVLVTGNQAFSQEPLTSQADRQLDSILHIAPVFGKMTIIYLSAHAVHVDTVDLKKYKFLKSDSAIVIKLKDKTEKHIKLDDFWGMTTDYGERRRFYHGRPLTVWRTKAPYLYKAKTNTSVFYFFSETPSGPVYPLSTGLIDTKVHDPKARDELYAYLTNEHIPIGTADKEKRSYEFLFAIGDALFTIAGGILECVVEALHR